MYRDPASHTITRSDADPENANQATSSTASTPNADRSPSQRVRRYDRGSEASFIADATSARRARLRHEAASRDSAAEGTPEPNDGKVGSKPNGGSLTTSAAERIRSILSPTTRLARRLTTAEYTATKGGIDSRPSASAQKATNETSSV
ncbi:hypothetical protein MHU86_15842 [Fragilaria crotonensis]|nr:hypothetical protein MHU86_15842 [Fragilaria crotonensis]